MLSMKGQLYPEDGCSKFIRNVDTYFISDTESKPRSPSSLRSTLTAQLLTRKHVHVFGRPMFELHAASAFRQALT